MKTTLKRRFPTRSRPTQFGHLAMIYYPDRGYRMAVRLFREELKITAGLMEALEKAGYHDNQRMLSPRQVKVIERFLGEAG